MNKSFALSLLAVLAFAGCSSSDDSPTNTAETGGTQGTGGNAVGTGGAAETGGGATGGSSANTGGSNANTGGSVVDGGTGGTTQKDAGSGGAAGSTPDATPFDGNVPDAMPTDYKGTPYGGTPQTIPGKIEVEKYDLGGNGVAFNHANAKTITKCGFTRTGDGFDLDCTDGRDKNFQGCGAEPAGEVYIGWVAGGEWYRYTVVVAETARYVISGHVGTGGGTHTVSFTFTPEIKTGNLSIPSTAGTCGTWESYHVWNVANNLGEIDLPAGKYVVTLAAVSGDNNLDWFEFKKK